MVSRKKSNLTKIIRAALRKEKQAQVRERVGRIPGETEEQELARKKRDLFGWLDMMTEREIEEGLLARVKEQEETQALQSTLPPEEEH